MQGASPEGRVLCREKGGAHFVLGQRRWRFPVCLAPMAGFTDSVFRSLCKSYGADIVVTEMVSAKGLYYANQKTAHLLRTAPEEEPVMVQLFGHDPAILSDMAKWVADKMGQALLAIDLNMGCPAPKIANNGDGSALMRTPALAGRLVEAVAKTGAAPVTVKFRKGWDEAHVNAVEFARICADSGAAAITLHPRTRSAMYAGRADWAVLAQVKAAVDIPVIGNGDIARGADALDMRRQTGVDGVMIGRAALGNPFIFQEIQAALAGKPYTPPTEKERRALALRHGELALAEKGPHALIELRKHIAWYIKSVPGAAKLRARVNECGSIAELREILA